MPPSVCEADRGGTRRGMMPAPIYSQAHTNRNPGSISTEELCHDLKRNSQSANTIEAANL